MNLKVIYVAWLLVISINSIVCQDKPGSNGGQGSGGGSGHGGGSEHGGGPGQGGGQGSGGGPGSGGGSGGGQGNMQFAMNGMNMMGGMNGMQLPFPFFPPFGCDVECLPIQIQLPQQPVTPKPTPPTTTTPPPTTMPPPKPTSPPQQPSQIYIVYPNWCQGWCRFFYKPMPPPVQYYQPNCILFSWMGMGMGMGMGMNSMQT